MNTENVLNDLEILLKAGQNDDAMTILKEFQRETLFDYKKWFEKNHHEGEQALHSYYINEFINKQIK